MKTYRAAYTFLTAFVVIALIIVALGFVWAQAILGQSRLVCTIDGEVVFDQRFDTVSYAPDAISVTLNGHTKSIDVPEGMVCH
jgi:hypothetical protein